MAEVTQIGETTARSGKVVARVETEMVRLKFISLRLFLYFALLKKNVIFKFLITTVYSLFTICQSSKQKTGKTGGDLNSQIL
jgi:hypothetical protein